MEYHQRPLIIAGAPGIWPVTTIFTDEADARGTVFEPPLLSEVHVPVMDGLVQQIEHWCTAGMPMGALPWQAATEVVEFKPAAGEFFLQGFLAQFELDRAGQTRLYLSARRIHASSDFTIQIEEWTKRCYRAVLHYYRVLLPLQDLPIRIVLVDTARW